LSSHVAIHDVKHKLLEVARVLSTSAEKGQMRGLATFFGGVQASSVYKAEIRGERVDLIGRQFAGNFRHRSCRGQMVSFAPLPESPF